MLLIFSSKIMLCIDYIYNICNILLDHMFHVLLVWGPTLSAYISLSFPSFLFLVPTVGSCGQVKKIKCRRLQEGKRNNKNESETTIIPKNLPELSHFVAHLVQIWPSGKLPFECQKITKNLTFFSKQFTKIVLFFNKIAIVNFFEKKCQVFGNFLTVKWQFSGGSDLDPK